MYMKTAIIFFMCWPFISLRIGIKKCIHVLTSVSCTINSLAAIYSETQSYMYWYITNLMCVYNVVSKSPSTLPWFHWLYTYILYVLITAHLMQLNLPGVTLLFLLMLQCLSHEYLSYINLEHKQYKNW